MEQIITVCKKDLCDFSLRIRYWQVFKEVLNALQQRSHLFLKKLSSTVNLINFVSDFWF